MTCNWPDRCCTGVPATSPIFMISAALGWEEMLGLAIPLRRAFFLVSPSIPGYALQHQLAILLLGLGRPFRHHDGQLGRYDGTAFHVQLLHQHIDSMTSGCCVPLLALCSYFLQALGPSCQTLLLGLPE